MLWSTVTAALTLLTFAPATLAVGTAYVVNNCGFKVYYASVSQGVAAGMQVLPAGGYSQQYSNPGDGVSIKMSPNATGPVTQFEFTWANGKISYDISNINGNPFAAQGMSLSPSMAGASGYPTCETVNCPAGQSTCSAAYNQPDDTATMVCPDASDLVFTLCTGSSHKREAEPFFRQLAHRFHARQFK